MGVLYHIRPYVVGIFPYIGLKNRPYNIYIYIYGRYLSAWLMRLKIKLLYFELSTPWHLYVLLLANLLAFYLISSGVLSGISSGSLSGRWGPPVPTELGGSQVEVQRCPLSSGGPRLTSSGAHCAQTLGKAEAGSWGPAVPTARGSWRRDWRRVGLRSSSAHCARKLAKRLAKSWQGGSGRGSWCRHGRGETGGGGGGGGGAGGGGQQLW